MPAPLSKEKGTLEGLIEQQGFAVIDGGLATELERRGESLAHPLWSAKILLSSPEKIAAIHHAYFAAGADIAITASYQATFQGFEAQGLTWRQAEAAIRQSVTLALEARERFWSTPENRIGRFRPLVAGSVGPYGAFLHDGSEYRGDYGVSPAALVSFHRDRFAVLAASGVDLLACETIPSLVEAEALLDLLGEFPHLPAWISFSCKDDKHISDGAKFADAIRLVCQSKSVVAAGVNCTAPRFLDSLLSEARAQTGKPLVAYPNSGEVYDSATCGWSSTSDVEAVEKAAAGWYERGARLLGGCCRTTPATIRGIRRELMRLAAGSGST